MIMKTRRHNDVLILYPEGKITLGDGDQELGEAVRTSLANGAYFYRLVSGDRVSLKKMVLVK